MIKKANCSLSHFCWVRYILLGSSFHLCLVRGQLLVISARNISHLPLERLLPVETGIANCKRDGKAVVT